MPRTRRAEEIFRRLVGAAAHRSDAVTHVERVAQRAATYADWPSWTDPGVMAAFQRHGIERPWSHQAEAAELLRAGRHTVLATGTASGKSLGYLLPALTAVLTPAPSERSSSNTARVGGTARAKTEPARATVLYLAPTKALAADQARRISQLDLPMPAAATLDADTSAAERRWIREHGAYVLSNPDMLHYSLLPDHRRWATFFRRLNYVIVDECHTYRGAFGSHVAAVLRRLRRISAFHGADPVFALASATMAEPATAAHRLTGLPVVPVTEDGSPHGGLVFALWEPPLTERQGEGGVPLRKSTIAETAGLLADLTRAKVRTVAFVRSRRGAEMVSVIAQEQLGTTPGRDSRAVAPPGTAPSSARPADAPLIAAYRAGYLSEDRRALEADLLSGRLIGLATTNALELGVDFAGLDAVLLAGYPGTRSSLWQQAGRAGRGGTDALAVLIARDDPLDTYLVHHPEALFGKPVEHTVLNPDNPYVLWPHLCAAASELPLGAADLELFGPTTRTVVTRLADAGWLRERPTGWYWTRPERAADLADLRGAGGTPVRIVEESTGRLIGRVDFAAAHSTVHEGAVYLHQGETYLVRQLRLDEATALVEAARPGYTTTAREVSRLRITAPEQVVDLDPGVSVTFGSVEVTGRVVSFTRRDTATGAILDEELLDLPERTLQTKAVWWTAAPAALERAQLTGPDVPGAAHAAEHALIGLLPLFAECDRWDIGGVSSAAHPDTGLATIFVHDGLPGGGGFAEQGFHRAAAWLAATQETLRACDCPTGCPSCVQSPKCGNGNHPLDKAGAYRLLGVLHKGD